MEFIVHKKRNLILAALLFVAVLSACIIITIKENNALVSSSSGSALSSSKSQSSSCAVLSSINITAASSLNNTDVEKFLRNFKQENNQYQFFDFALSTCDFSEDMIEAAVSFYSDKKSPLPCVMIMSKYGIKNINLVNDSIADTDSFVFVDDGKITITGQNDLTVTIQNTKTKEIIDCVITYHCSDYGHKSSWNIGWHKRNL